MTCDRVEVAESHTRRSQLREARQEIERDQAAVTGNLVISTHSTGHSGLDHLQWIVSKYCFLRSHSEHF